MEQKKLPADPSAMTLGIIALVLTLTSCCCGFSALIALVLSIIGLVNANRSLREYKYNAENYYPESRTNVYNAKILNLISLIISSLGALVLYLLVYGTFIFSEILNEPLYQYHHNEDDYRYDDSDEQETYEDQEDEDEGDFLYPCGA